MSVDEIKLKKIVSYFGGKNNEVQCLGATNELCKSHLRLIYIDSKQFRGWKANIAAK